MKNKYSWLFILPLMIAFSCDTIDGPYIENTNGQLNSDVILFEFTGMKCVYCPQGHIAIEELKDLYGDKIRPIAIHAGDFAEPDIDFPADYRTDAGNTLYDYMEPLGFPSGAVNSFSPDSVVAVTAWATRVAQQGKQNPVALLTVTISIADSVINLKIITQSTSMVESDYRLCAYLIEDRVIGKQKDGSKTIEDYEHNHMLRAVFGNVWGKEIDFGTKSESNFSLKLQSKWNKDNLSVVPFILDYNSKKIIPTEVNFTE